MRKISGGFWSERQTRDWFYIKKRGNRYFSSGWITCVDAVQILKGKQPTPRTCLEVKDMSVFEPVPEGVIRLLTKAMESHREASRFSRIG